MDTILVTGGTGTLGRSVVAKLREAAVPVRVLSRRAGAGIAVGDLGTGAGLPAALAGVGTVVHCASGRNDPRQTANLIAAASSAGVRHLVYISIVGVDRHPFAYYRAKFAAEQLIQSSPLPFTILRATQFHTLVAGICAAQRRSPVLLAPDIPVQPVDAGEVAGRLVELSLSPAAGRVADFGGPEVRRFLDLAGEWKQSTGRRGGLVPLKLPGKTFAAFAAGLHTAPEHATGTITFEQFLAR